MCCCDVLTPPPPPRTFPKYLLSMASFSAAAGISLRRLLQFGLMAYVEVYKCMAIPQVCRSVAQLQSDVTVVSCALTSVLVLCEVSVSLYQG